VGIFLFSVLLSGLNYYATESQDARDPIAVQTRIMEQRVMEELKKEGIQAGTELTVKLEPDGKGQWQGTATFGTIVYDLSVKAGPHGFEYTRRQRSP
jgi:hypothetical protein